jgi:hypothetical protein
VALSGAYFSYEAAENTRRTNPAAAFYQSLVIFWILVSKTAAIKDRVMAVFHLWTPPFRQGKTSGSFLRVVGCCHLLMRQEDSRRPVWEFRDRVQITQSVLEAQWEALVVPAPSSRPLRHTPSARPHVLAIVSA